MNDLVSNELYHHGILGMKWGVRRYQNPDGTLTEAGKKRYAKDLGETYFKAERNQPGHYWIDDYAATVKSHEKLNEIANSKKLRDLYDAEQEADYEWDNYKEANKNDYYGHMAAEVRARLNLIRDQDTLDWYHYGYTQEDLDQGDYNSFSCYLISKGINPDKYGRDIYDAHKKYEECLNESVDNLLGEYGKESVNGGITPKYVAETGIDRIIEKESKNHKYGYMYADLSDSALSQLEDVKRYVNDYEHGYRLNFKHSDLSEDFLKHWGILGMKWGVRRYQNKDGSLTSAGRSRYGSGKKKVGILEAHRIKKRKAEAAKKRAETLAKKKAEEEDAQKHEAEKQEAIRSGNATQIAKFQNELSNQELRDALDRLNSKQRLSDMVAKETPKKKTKLDRAMEIADKASKAADVAEKGIKAYNTFAKVSNAFADDKNQLPIIGEKREKKAPKNEAKEAAIRSGDAKEIAKWKGKLTPEETKTAMLTLDYWDKIKEKSVSSTVKEQKEGQKAAAKELAEKLYTHSDEYNEAVKRARDLDLRISEQNRAERKQRVDEAKTALKELVNPSERTKTIREYSNAEIGSKEVIDRILKDLEKNRR